MKKFDLYLSYNQDDSDKIKEISKLMLKEHKTLKLYDQADSVEEDSAFQNKILDAMRQCRR